MKSTNDSVPSGAVENYCLTKTSHREYIGSSYWQQRRREYLENHDSCVRCQMPRWLAEIAYDQDLNVHHVSYANKGHEQDEDLESLCRRCHEIEKFGRSDLREPKSTLCELCGAKHWNCYSPRCGFCRSVTSRGLANIVRLFDDMLDGCKLLTVNNYLIALLMLHHQGPDNVLEIWRKVEPHAKRARNQSRRRS
jgi:hypothetical protein